MVDRDTANTIDYSTTEQDTGRKWIDGKLIYQKTYTSEQGYTSSTPIDVSTLNIETLINIEAIGSDNTPYASNNKWIVSSIGGVNNRYVYLDTNDNIIFGSAFPVFVITLWYTKTS